MFDMAKWDSYLAQYCQDAEREGATSSDLLELFVLQIRRLTPLAKAEQVYRTNLRANLTQYARKSER